MENVCEEHRLNHSGGASSSVDEPWAENSSEEGVKPEAEFEYLPTDVTLKPHPFLGWITGPFTMLLRHRALIRAMAEREIIAPYAGQMLGGVWAFCHPLFFIALLVVVFNYILG